MSKTKVSIIIPCYNCEEYIEETLEKLKKQSYTCFEVILINDGSNDGTYNKIKNWLIANPQIQGILIDQENKFQGAARNTGIKRSKYEYIAFLDADDYWDGNKLEICMKHLENNPDIDLLCHDEFIIKNGRISGIVTSGPYKTFEDLLLKGNCLSPSAVIAKREVLLSVNGFNESPKYFSVEDFDLWLRLSKANINIEYLNEPLGYYKLHLENSTVARLENHLLNLINLYNDHSKGLSQKHGNIVKKKISNVFMQLAIFKIRNGEIAEGINLVVNTLKSEFFNLKNWYYLTKILKLIIFRII
jgi:glycosyltransferase involved in cell wall biosynthesis